MIAARLDAKYSWPLPRAEDAILIWTSHVLIVVMLSECASIYNRRIDRYLILPHVIANQDIFLCVGLVFPTKCTLTSHFDHLRKNASLVVPRSLLLYLYLKFHQLHTHTCWQIFHLYNECIGHWLNINQWLPCMIAIWYLLIKPC